MMSKGKAINGYSLIELVVAMSIGAAVSIGVVQLAGSFNSTYVANESITNMQERGRFAINLLADRLRRRGYFGCLQPAVEDAELYAMDWSNLDWTDRIQVNPVANAVISSNLALTTLRGYEVSDSGLWVPNPANDPSAADVALVRATDTQRNPAPRKNSDVVSVQYASVMSAELQINMTSRDSNIVISEQDQQRFNFQRGDVVFIGDCHKADVFAITNNPSPVLGRVTLRHDGSLNSSEELNNVYLAGSNVRIRRFHNYIYYVADTRTQFPNGETKFGLYQKDVTLPGNDAELLLEGTEFLQLQYGVRNENGNMEYRTADHVDFVGSGMLPVVSVRVGVLLKDGGNLLSQVDTEIYPLPGASISPDLHGGKKSLKKTFEQTVLLRNRG